MFFQNLKQNFRDFYISGCLIFQVYAGMMLTDKYIFRVIGTSGPSMLPTFDSNNNLLIVD
jgi:hypothetical protein